ncbi:MAG TPA: hypothetical protein PK830_02770 [Candidatus Atribacteria bacterium]|nr:hypothetical protein [Candidatus Atribacteria bacterium]HPT78014.1 hypothetical protein [Candidatus Atribacteria bacterium]
MKSSWTSRVRLDYRFAFRAGVLILIAILAYLVLKPVQITVNDKYIRINGLYGVTVRVEDILELKHTDELPPIISRLNGIDLFGLSRRGIYQLKDIGRARMISFSTGGPFILINAGSEWIVINFKSPDETESLYRKLYEVIYKDR